MNSHRGLPRVLEIGEKVFSGLLPEQTTWVGRKKEICPVRERMEFTPRTAISLWRRIARGEFDLIVISYIKVTLWRHDRFFLKNLYTIFKSFLKFEALAPYLLLLVRRKNFKFIIIDRLDTMVIGTRFFPFFPRIDLFFKRELPQNIWHAFLFTSSRNEDVSNIRRQPFFCAAKEKLRPFPLQVQPRFDYSEIRPEQKTADIFYVGDNAKTTVRMEGLKVLQKLRDRGWRVDMPEERLDREEFFRRIASAWLVWSPEGSGWDCHRHYETLVHGAVPVMNYPTIYRYHPLIEGEHAFYYGCEGDDLVRVVEKALEDKNRLLKMIQAGREHVTKGNTPEAVLRYILNECGMAADFLPR